VTPISELRALALQEAIRSSRWDASPAQVVERAEEFYKFLRGAAS
jgi:hypothetical protein